MTGWTLYFADVNHVHAVSPVTLLILKLNSVLGQDITVYFKVVVVAGFGDKLHSVSPHGILIPVGLPLKSQLAVCPLGN
jgi:hypothetical protein